MKVSSLPNLNRETTSFPNFFTIIQDPADRDDTTLNLRPNNDHGDYSETSPFKDILSPSVSFGEMNEIGFLAGTNSVGLIRCESVQTQHNTSSVGSNQFSGGGSATSGSTVGVGPNPTQLRLWDQCSQPDFPELEYQFSGCGSATGGSTVGVGPNRNRLWWDQCSHPDFPESEFRRAFKMSKSTFEFICSELDRLINKDIILRLAIPPVSHTAEILLFRQRVAMCIWWLATGEPLHLVSKKFGLGISTCHKLVLEVCGAITNVLMNKFLNWPLEEKMTRVKREFELASGIPNVGGSMYTTHLPIIAPEVDRLAYFMVQGVVDSKGVFMDICIGWPGSTSDDKILENSELWRRASSGLLKDVWILGNSGYPLMDWLLVPYTHKDLTWTQHAFNKKIGEVQTGAKEAFSRLKGRWSCLQMLTEVKLQDLPAVVGAAFVLHNICEMRNEAMDPGHPAKTSFDPFDDEIVPKDAVRSVDAMRARDQIAHHLLCAWCCDSIVYDRVCAVIEGLRKAVAKRFFA
ncbi:hypothetical protein RHSIM_Rhsim05G0017600 [Rhododendron simsii]|uniref:DDE Tnp4 domain-containing protein n=1 Tax=Rhododendron simsii TaxID=118357 RepID=A0A834LKX3_RHOSS|nr:hypothetical protein RHSIM_Rhsim05G0017600 [Rhododendron simsii]